MRRKKLINVVFATIVFLTFMDAGCSDKNEVEGRYKDNIHLSKKNVDFNAKASSDVITTKGEGWKFDVITDNDVRTDYSNEKEEIKDYSSDWITVTKADEKTIKFEVQENKTGKQRILYLALFNWGYSDLITVTQEKAE
ncbi:hypothetical protein D0T84_20820 [Dysgonomonas sp. 521]|uniref:BACON domain-containing protein n=1 Tax=Dysgonomonas sp. 521 TaxID=2302932 RepID=UPI0013D53B45|nr:BACON domain-containing carbohydrate-binding protein [Dysgonomonas sp. 521]NDV97322.1 hypothetical protein [Dysgonomonas sp. 521]